MDYRSVKLISLAWIRYYGKVIELRHRGIIGNVLEHIIFAAEIIVENQAK